MTIAPVARKTTLHEANDDARDLAYWLSKPMAERIGHVELLRKQALDALPEAERCIQKVYRVTTLKRR